MYAENYMSSEYKNQYGTVPEYTLFEKTHTTNYKGSEVYQKNRKEQQPKKTTVMQHLQPKTFKTTNAKEKISSMCRPLTKLKKIH